MKKDDNQPASFPPQRVEEVLRNKAAESKEGPQPMSPEAVSHLLHELRVHQVELEMQNEELRLAQGALDAARLRYLDLYDFAPVGYATVNGAGLILEANLAAAALLGNTRADLVGQPFSRFILGADQDIFYLHRRLVSESGEAQSFELRMLNLREAHFWAHLEVAAAEHTNEEGAVLRIALSDVTRQKHAEIALKESEEQYRTLVEWSPDPIGVFRGGKLVYVNPAGIKLFGAASAQDLLGKPILDRVHPDFHQIVMSRLKNAAEHAIGAPLAELRYLKLDGTPIDVEAISTPITYGGKPAVQIAMHNVSERRAAEDKLRHVSRLYALRSQISQAIVRTKDQETLFRVICQVAIEFGRFRMAWVGVQDGFQDRVNPVAHAGWVDGYLDSVIISSGGDTPNGRGPAGLALRTGEIVTSSDIATDPRMAPWRAEALKRGYRSAAAVPFKREDQSFGALILYATEPGFFTTDEQKLLQQVGEEISFALAAMVSEARRKETEATLQESEQRLRTIIQTEPECVNLVGAKGELLEMNAAGLAMLEAGSVEEVSATGLFGFIAPQYQAAFGALHSRVMRGESDLMEFEIIGLRGTRRWLETHAAPMWDAHGKVTMMLGIMRDITERKHAEAEKARLEVRLQEAQKMESVGRLAGGVAHDFNNMLAVIHGHAELALCQVAEGQGVHDDLVEIQKAAERSAELVRQLLTYASKQTVLPQVLDLGETVTGMIKLLERLIGEDIQLIWQTDPALWPVLVDASQLDQLLANLCVNARDAIANVGTIAIDACNTSVNAEFCADHLDAVPGEYVRLTVRDTGCGMDRETLTHIFEPFYTTKPVGEGTGLGLSTVYGTVKQNRGFITVSSELGKGTLFSIYFPRHLNPPERIRKAEVVQPAVMGKETILVVEDEAGVLKVATRALRAKGYTILGAGTPEEAILLAKAYLGDIQLLLTDVVMPGMNGRDLSRALLASNPHLKTLFMSGFTADVITHRGVLDTGVHFIQKPFTVAALAKMVRQVLDQ